MNAYLSGVQYRLASTLFFSPSFFSIIFTLRLNSQQVLPSATSWTSRGHRCLPFSPPVHAFIFIAHRVQHFHSSVFHARRFSSMLHHGSVKQSTGHDERSHHISSPPPPFPTTATGLSFPASERENPVDHFLECFCVSPLFFQAYCQQQWLV